MASRLNLLQRYNEEAAKALKGNLVWRALQKWYVITKKDHILFLPTDNDRCNLAALSSLEEWLLTHTGQSIILHTERWDPSIANLPVLSSRRVTCHELDDEDVDALMAFYRMHPAVYPWFKVASLEGEHNTFRIIEALNPEQYQLEELFSRHLYLIEHHSTRTFPEEAITKLYRKRGPRSTVNYLLRRFKGVLRLGKWKLIGNHEPGEFLQSSLESAEAGVPFAEKLLHEYGNEATIFLIRQKPIGDILFVLQNIRTSIEKNKLEHYVIVCHKRNAKRVKELMQFYWSDTTHLVSVPFAQLEAIETLLFLIGSPPSHFITTQYLSALPRERVMLLLNQPGLSYVEYLRYCAYELDSNDPTPPTCWKNDIAQNQQRLLDAGLKPGRTVVISPSTVSGVGRKIDLCPLFWEQLVSALHNAGFSVATNLTSPSDKPIAGSVGLFFSLKEAPGILDAAGMLVSIRSGFCDLATLSACKKVILYPDVLYPNTHGYRTGFYADFWSLASIECPENLLELVHHGADNYELIPFITSFFLDNTAMPESYKSYRANLQEFRALQRKLLSCRDAFEYFTILKEYEEDNPFALLFVSKGRYTYHLPTVPWDILGIDVPTTKEAIVDQGQFMGIWDSQSHTTEYKFSYETIMLSRCFGNYCLGTKIDIDEETEEWEFAGFTVTFDKDGPCRQEFKFEKEDACSGVNFAVFSLAHNTIIDCFNVNTGGDKLLGIRRFR